MPGGQHGADPRRDLAVAIGDAPVDPRVVEINPEDAVVFRAGRGRHAVVKLGLLDVHGHPSGEVLQPARVVVVQVADGNRADVGHVHACPGERLGQRLPGPGSTGRITELP
jgi:hypothetical protein